MSAPQDLINRYRSAFTRGDMVALMDCFGFPVQVLSVTDGQTSTSVRDRDQWAEVLTWLLDAYQRLGVTDAVPLALEITEPMEAVAVVPVRWQLRRADGGSVYEFSAVYTMARADGRLLIFGIGHDETSRIQSALRGT